MKEQSSEQESEKEQKQSKITSEIDTEEEKKQTKFKTFEITSDFQDMAHNILQQEGDSKIKAFFYQKYQKEAQKNWDLFYKANQTHFFKDRHYFEDEFPQIYEFNRTHESTTLLDVGCGVGNALYPLIKEMSQLRVNAVDFSKRAVQFVKTNELYDPKRIAAQVWDITKEELPYGEDPSDFAILIFVLSSLSPETMTQALKNIASNLKSGGLLYFRDYGMYDWAQLRFAKLGKAKLKDNFYIRKELTRAYYFTLEEVESLFEDAGFEKQSLENHYRVIENRKEEKEMKRVWVQGKFRKK